VALQWITYVAIAAARPSWFLAVWGHDATWSLVQGIWIAAMVAQKVGLFGLALILVWATWWRSAMSNSRRDDASGDVSRPGGAA
jgi:hypothetical protein